VRWLVHRRGVSKDWFACIRLHAHVSDKTNALARDGADQNLRVTTVANSLPRRANTADERGVRHDPAAPDIGDQIVFADDTVAVLHQIDQEVENLRLDGNRLGPAAQLLPSEIEREFAKEIFHVCNRKAGRTALKDKSTIRQVPPNVIGPHSRHPPRAKRHEGAQMPELRQITYALFVSIAIAACASSGSGGGTTVLPPPAPQTQTQPQPPSGPQAGLYYDTGLKGTIGVPAPASSGPAPAPAQLATSSSPKFLVPNFSGSGPTFPSNVTFPALSTSLEFTSTGLAPVTPNQGATVTVVSMSGFSRTLQLVVPSVNVNTTIFQDNADLNPDEGVTVNLNYVALGTWGTGASERRPWLAPAWQKDVTQFAFGYETPAAAMPTGGTATFIGSAYANVFTSDATISAAIVLGGASFAVDFSTGNISGAFSNWQQSGSSGLTPSFLPWNSVSINASIAAGTSHFSGNTAVTSNPGTKFSLSSSATGHIVGGFYGPGAEEIGAVWSLSDGTSSALGGVMGAR
jgi:hypothetical protein